MSTYVLITAAYNEERYIETTIQSVASQSIPPKLWVIVSDGSTDRTDEIVRKYAETVNFIRLCRREKQGEQGFSSKVFALRAGLSLLDIAYWQFLGHLDADVSIEPSYFADLLKKFRCDSKLGVAGGTILEFSGGAFRPRRSNSLTSVAGAVQMFRRECYCQIGELLPIKYGGEDWYAEVRARMCGWRVESFIDLPVFHHRPTGTADRLLRHRFRQGKMDFSLGSYPLFELIKCLKRIPERPIAAGAIARLLGFAWGSLREERLVTREFMRFLRQEQKRRLLGLSE